MSEPNSIKQKNPNPLIAAAAGLVLFLSAVVVSQTVASSEKGSIQYQVSMEASNLRERVEERLEERILAMQRMARRWSNENGIERQRWEDEALAYYNDFGGIQAIEWVDPTFHVRWVVPRGGNEVLLGFDLGSEERRRQALEQARDTRQPSVSRPVDLLQGGKGFLVYVPLYVGERFDGFLVSVFRIGDMLNVFLGRSVLNGYAITIQEGGQEIYATESGDKMHQSGFGTTLPLILQGNNWEMSVWPQPETVEARSTNLAAVIRGFGILIGLLVGIAIYLAQTARHRSLSVLYANRALKSEVTERKRAEAALQQQLDFDRQVLETMGQGLTIVGADGRFEYVNPAYASMLGQTPEALIGRSPSEFTYTEDLSVLGHAMEKRAHGEKSVYETKLKRGDGTPIYAHITGVPRRKNGKLDGAITVITDLSDRKKLEQALRDLSTRDELTGLYNRRAFNEILREEWDNSGSNNWSLSLVLLDVDYFKRVNDNYGHQAGDEVLRWIGRLVTSNSRSQDRVARFGGEEIAVVMPDTTAEEAKALAERLRRVVAGTDFILSEGMETRPISTQITVSLGVATLRSGGSIDGLISDADKALYRAKRTGRNKVVQAQPRDWATRLLSTVPLRSF